MNVVLRSYPREVQKLVASRGDLQLTGEWNSTGHLRDLMWLFKKRDCLLKVAFGSYCYIYAVSKKVNQDEMNIVFFTRENQKVLATVS